MESEIHPHVTNNNNNNSASRETPLKKNAPSNFERELSCANYPPRPSGDLSWK